VVVRLPCGGAAAGGGGGMWNGWWGLGRCGMEWDRPPLKDSTGLDWIARSRDPAGGAAAAAAPDGAAA
jgi:hypothetical protein